jgi:hypothetical protein
MCGWVEPRPHSSRPVTIKDLAWPAAWVRSLRALRLATISTRIAPAAPLRPLGTLAGRTAHPRRR